MLRTWHFVGAGAFLLMVYVALFSRQDLNLLELAPSQASGTVSAPAEHAGDAARPSATAAPPTKPNFIFILTDDQDARMESMHYMPRVKKYLADKGTTYRNHFCTVAICCPSRASLLTGMTAHNTNVTDLSPPYGGYPKFVDQGLNDAYLPIWLQEGGYNTYYTGKLFNSHTVSNYHSPHAAGWTGSDFLLDPYTYSYLGAQFQRNKDAPKDYTGQYSTDVVANKTHGWLEDALEAKKPFFITVAPIAPHTNIDIIGGEGFTPPIPADRHKDMFRNAKVPRSPNFNPDEPSSVNWIRQLDKQETHNLANNDNIYRRRLQALQAVDEMVESLVQRLSSHSNVLENTYIIYTSDNGFHIGQHRLQPGKECGFDEDINVPLIIRGPGVPAGVVTHLVSSHTDLAPTFLNLAGIKLQDTFDGVPIPTTKEELDAAAKDSKEGTGDFKEHSNVEYWGVSLNEGSHGKAWHGNNTYKAIRLVGQDYSLYYSVWCSNEHELYDMKADPYQLHNLFTPGTDDEPFRELGPAAKSQILLGRPAQQVANRLDTLLMMIKTCKGVDCVKPWKAIHPTGDVKTLKDALDEKFDKFYEEEQERVSFGWCAPGHIIAAEGPQDVTPYGILRVDPRWSDWT